MLLGFCSTCAASKTIFAFLVLYNDGNNLELLIILNNKHYKSFIKKSIAAIRNNKISEASYIDFMEFYANTKEASAYKGYKRLRTCKANAQLMLMLKNTTLFTYNCFNFFSDTKH